MLAPTVLLPGFRALLGALVRLTFTIPLQEAWSTGKEMNNNKKSMSVLGLGKQTQKADNHNFKKYPAFVEQSFYTYRCMIFKDSEMDMGIRVIT